jgi:hypothetical protein
MGKCKNCGVEHEAGEVCVFATYRTNIGGVETTVCCERCGTVAAKPAAVMSPAKKAPAKKAPKRTHSKKLPKRKSPKKHSPKKKASANKKKVKKSGKKGRKR